MKMIIAIVQDKFIDELMDRFLDEEIYVTKISTTGGFLKGGNTTLLLGCEDNKLEDIDKIFKEITKTEKFKNDKGEFHISGATVFVLDVEKSLRV
ncbi:cyclic-di-AMP receptor [Peptoniphilus catoniae]|uniref:cyclic-di-AMP receptor n=1 Tax=Peptoniphilus catoniae TaxID=1660341 RepID=UPI0010FF26A2|nr:cyclic-di-AMP receptor [Peptoniphilus catoniae]